MLRDHLANERTLLAWLRTSIAATGLGIVGWHIGERGLGSCSLWAAAAMLGVGLFRYVAVRLEIEGS